MSTPSRSTRSPARAACRWSATRSTSTRSSPIEGFMRMAAGVRADLPARRCPGGTRLIVSGAPTWSTRSATTRGSTRWSAAACRTCARARPDAGLFTAETDGPAVAPSPQHPDVAVQPAGDARLHAEDGRHRRAADGQVGPAQPGRGGRRPGRHDPADPGHHRAVRVRLPLQLLLPRAPRTRSSQAMVRTLAEAQARARQLPIQTRLRIRAQRQVEEDQAFMNDLVDQLIAERRARATRRTPPTCSAGCSPASTSSPGRRLPDANIRAQCITFLIAGHETTSGLLSFAIYYLLKNPDFLERARAEVDEVLGSDRVADVRAGAPAHLRPPDPRRGAAAVADRAGVHPLPVRGHRDRRPVRHPGAHPDHGADAGAAPGHRPCGDRTRPSSTPSTWRRSGWPPSRRTSTSRSAPASAPASAGSSPCRRPRWCSACCCSASTSSTTSTTS